VWQHPYVDVLRQLSVFEGKHSKIVGDVKASLDPTLNKRVLCIRGHVSAANYLELPGPGATATERARNPAAARVTSLGLTGEYMYIQLRAIAEKFFSVHIDITTTNGLVIRLSLSNIFKHIKVRSEEQGRQGDYRDVCMHTRAIDAAVSVMERGDECMRPMLIASLVYSSLLTYFSLPSLIARTRS
jgi:hypothetical protein